MVKNILYKILESLYYRYRIDSNSTYYTVLYSILKKKMRFLDKRARISITVVSITAFAALLRCEGAAPSPPRHKNSIGGSLVSLIFGCCTIYIMPYTTGVLAVALFNYSHGARKILS